MKRILVNATHAEEIRVALCNGNHVYDFDLENRTREQKKANIYKGHVTRVEPSLEAVFVEYGSERQGFLSIREIAKEYLSGDPRNCKNIKEIISEGTELLVQVEKEERGNKGAALSTFISLAGRYLVLMPNNASGGGISRQISGNVRDEMKRMLAKLQLPKSMSVIIRTAGIGRSQEDLQNDLNHLLDIWKNINLTAQNTPSPCLAHREAGVVTRAVRDYLREDIAEVWIDNEQAYNEAYHFVQAVMPHQLKKLRKYLDFEPMFSSFGVESQIETAYQREVKLPSGGSIVIDQTEALVSIDINSAKATKGADVESTAHNTNLEAAEEIARQLRLRDMGGLIVIDFIDMLDEQHRKDVEQRLKDATQYDRARIQFTNISRFGLLEMSRQRLRPSLEESTGFVCPRCHGNGMIRDLRSLALSIMRHIEKLALKEGRGEIQAQVPIEIGAFLLNEKRDSLVYLEQDSGARITILPHAHLETPNYHIHFNQAGYAPSSYERVNNVQAEQTQALGYETNWQTNESQPAPHQRHKAQQRAKDKSNKHAQKFKPQTHTEQSHAAQSNKNQPQAHKHKHQSSNDPSKPEVCAWLTNLFTPPQQAQTSNAMTSQSAAAAIESHINSGAVSRGVHGQVDFPENEHKPKRKTNQHQQTGQQSGQQGSHKKVREDRRKKRDNQDHKKDHRQEARAEGRQEKASSQKQKNELPKREAHSKRPSRGERERNKPLNTPAENQQPSKPSKNTDPNQVMVNVVNTAPAQEQGSQFVNIDMATGGIEKSPVQASQQQSHANEKQTAQVENAANQQTQPRQQPEKVQKATQPSAAIPQTKQVAANTLGRAKNDPREQSTPVKITGTAGAFIQATFAENAEKMLAEQGLVASFVAALNAQKQTADTVQPLPEEAVQAFRAAISPVAHAKAAAGTADAKAPAAAYRASNDPRGRIAGFDTVPAHLLISSSATDSDNTNKGSDEAQGTSVQGMPAPAEQSPTKQTPNKPADTVNTAAQSQQMVAANTTSILKGKTAGMLVTEQLGAEAQAIIAEQSFAAAFVQALAKALSTKALPAKAAASTAADVAASDTAVSDTTADNQNSVSGDTASTEAFTANANADPVQDNAPASTNLEADNPASATVDEVSDTTQSTVADTANAADTAENSNKKASKKPAAKKTRATGRPRKKAASDTTAPADTTDSSASKSVDDTADTGSEEPAKPKKATRQRRTSKKASADKVTITKKVTEAEPTTEAANAEAGKAAAKAAESADSGSKAPSEADNPTGE